MAEPEEGMGSTGAEALDLAHSYGMVLERQQGGTGEGAQEPSPPPVVRIVEAMLFVGGEPLTAERAAEAVRGLTAEQFTEAVGALNRDYRRQGRPYRIQARGAGYELVLLPRFRIVSDRLYGSTREARLSPAALDVLCLVAYRQPITRQEVDSLRGADSGSGLRQLVRLGLIAVQRTGEAGAAKEAAYVTTPRFLSLFQMRSLDDLPRTQDLHRL
jgi:segregation and condensation protein B